MVLTSPELRFKNSGGNVRKNHIKNRSGQDYYWHTRKNSFDSIYTPTKNQEPLKAGSNQLAFKGFGFLRGTKELLFKKEVRNAGDILRETTEKYINVEELSGLKFLEGHIKRTIKPSTNRSLVEENINVANPVWENFGKAVISGPKAIHTEIKKLLGGREYREQVRASQKNHKHLNQLLGYFFKGQKYTREFNGVFSGDNLTRVRAALQKDSPDELREVLKKGGIKPEVILRKGENEAEDFAALKKGLLDGEEKGFLDGLRKKYITGTIQKEEAKKIGSIMPHFSNNSLQFINRAISSSITAAYVANDFFNLKMLASDNKEKAKEERNKMFMQQITNASMSVYLAYVLNTTLKRPVNKSLKLAIGIGAATSLASNVLSRVVNGIPLLPVHPKKLDQEPYVIHAMPIEKNIYNRKEKNYERAEDRPFNPYQNTKTYRSFRGIKNNVSRKDSSLGFSGWNPSGIIKGVREAATHLDEKAVHAMPAKMSKQEFSKLHEFLEHIDSGTHANVLREIAGKYMKHLDDRIPKDPSKVTLSDIEKAADKNNGKVIIGSNGLYRFGKSVGEAAVLPFKLVVGVVRGTINLGLKGLDKIGFKSLAEKQIPKAQKNRYRPEVAARNLAKWTAESKAESVKTGIKAEELFGKHTSSFHGPDVMDYGGDQLSTGMKLTGLLSIPFLAVNAYNTSAKTTGNKNIAQEKAKQRAFQDTARQGVSFWAVKSWNDIFIKLNNHSLPTAALSVFMNCTGYEALTRLAVGQPLTPKSHEEMKQIEKERLKRDGWFAKIMGRKVETDDDNDKVYLQSQKLKEYPIVVKSVDNKFVSAMANTHKSQYTRMRSAMKNEFD